MENNRLDILDAFNNSELNQSAVLQTAQPEPKVLQPKAQQALKRNPA